MHASIRPESKPDQMGSALPDCAYQLTDAVQHQVNTLLAHRIVPTGIIVSRILLPRDQLLGMEELAVGSCPHLICQETGPSDPRFQEMCTIPLSEYETRLE